MCPELCLYRVCVHPLVSQADLRRKERDYTLAQKEIFDLEKQVKIDRISDS